MLLVTSVIRDETGEELWNRFMTPLSAFSPRLWGIVVAVVLLNIAAYFIAERAASNKRSKQNAINPPHPGLSKHTPPHYTHHQQIQL